MVFGFIFDWLINNYGGDIQEIKNRLVEIIVMLNRLSQNYEMNNGTISSRDNYLTEFFEIKDISKLKSWCRYTIEQITTNINNTREKKLSSLILKAQKYINDNYFKDITLEDVSIEVSVSPHYFSKLFKSETGENFIDYLTAVRISKAKAKLEEGNESVKEICYQVGYSDPNYFSRIFKKIVGVTPTEFKETPKLLEK
jgi:two-component system response regulator YesN